MTDKIDDRWIRPLPTIGRAPYPWAFIGLIAVCAVLARLVYVQLFSSPIPFWDQWDGEADRVLRPWIEGHFDLGHLLLAHNEHRIVPTKLVTIALYELTGRWSNMDEARFTAVLYGVIPAMLIWSIFADDRPRAPALVQLALAVVVLLFAVLPFSWENMLIGFQSQFYFMLASGIGVVILAARQHDNLLAAAAVLALSAFACLTMASGLITPLVAICVYTLACIFLPGRRWPALLTMGILLVLALATYATTPQIPQHQALRPASATEFLNAVTHILSWPASSYRWAMICLWLPTPIMLLWHLAHRQITRADVVMAGLYGWSLAQGLAIAAGRGQGLVDVPSRYIELLVPGLFANAWFALSLLHDQHRVTLRIRVPALLVSIAFFLVLLGGLLVRTPGDLHELRVRSAALTVQRENTLQYLRSNDPAVFDAPFFALPYPDHARLKLVLDTPAIREALHWTQPLPAPPPPPVAE